MKKLITYFIACIALINLAQAQWSAQNPQLTSESSYKGFSSPDSNTIWLVADEVGAPLTQAVSVSINGGTSFTKTNITSFANHGFSNISAINKDTAWVAIYSNTQNGGGAILRTNDRGATWNPQTTATFNSTNSFPNAVHFYDKDNGIAVGDPSNGYFEIYTTANGGTTWARKAQTATLNSGTEEYGTINRFVAKGNGFWYPTTKKRILYSNNRGQSWQSKLITYQDDTVSVNWIAAKTETELLASTYSSKYSKDVIAKSTDGGNTWTTSIANGYPGHMSCTYVKTASGYGYYLATYETGISLSVDGQNWSTTTVPFNLAQYQNAQVTVAPTGQVWIGGKFSDINNTSFYKYNIPNLDIHVVSISTHSGNTTCLVSDSVKFTVVNSGRNAINFATTNADVNLNYYGRPENDPNFQGPFTLSGTHETGQLLPGATTNILLKGYFFNFGNFILKLAGSVNLQDGNNNQQFNDNAAEITVNSVNSISATTAGGVPSTTLTVFNGQQATLTCSGTFTSIKWQKLLDTSWVDVALPGSQANNFTFTPLETTTYRAWLCNLKASGSVTINVAKIGAVVGNTFYDLQSNSSVNSRIALTGNRKLAVYTGSTDGLNESYATRGSFYHANTGAGWNNMPTTRIENIRTGFSTIAATTNGKEVVVAHNAATSKLVSNRRAVAGIGSWTEQVDFARGMWPQITAATGDTVHMIALDSGHVIGNFIRYYRSTNAGASWDINIPLPGFDAINGFHRALSDHYKITAHGSTVVIIAGGYATKLVMWKSSNSGATWTTKTIKSLPVSNIDGNFVFPYTLTTDGSVTAVIDNNNKAHVVTGLMHIEDQIPNDNDWNYYPGDDGLLYWNENWPTDSLVTITNSSQANYPNGQSSSFYRLGLTGITSYASATINRTSGDIYVTFTAPVPNTAVGDVNDRRDVFGIMTPNGGSTWSVPVNLTQSAVLGIDNMFCSNANNSQTAVFNLWQASTLPEINLTSVIASPKQIVVDSVPYHRFFNIDFRSFTKQGNCAGDSAYVEFNSVGRFNQINIQLSDSAGNFTNSTLVKTIANTNADQRVGFVLPAVAKTSSNYRMRLVSNDGLVISANTTTYTTISKTPNKPIVTANRALTFCEGDSTVLQFNPAQTTGLVHNWYYNNNLYPALSNTLVLNSSYKLQLVAESNGCSSISDTITITANPSPEPAIVLYLGDSAFCEGSNTQLRAASGPQIKWYRNSFEISGATDSLLMVSTPGNYSYKVTLGNCSRNSANAPVTAKIKPNMPSISGFVAVFTGTTANYGIPVTAGSQYNWSVINGTTNGRTDSNYVSATWSISGIGALTLIETNTGGCKDTAVLLVAVGTDTIVGVADDSLLFSTGLAQTRSIGVGANTAWTVSTNQTWITLDRNNGAGTEQLGVTVTENPAQPRTGLITVKSGTKQATILVWQASKPIAPDTLIMVSNDTIEFGTHTAQNQSVVVEGNYAWSVAANQPWVSLNRAGGAGAETIEISVTENQSIIPRAALVTASSGTKKATVFVSQPGKPIGTDTILEVSEDTVIFGTSAAQLQKVIVGGNKAWSISANQTWITLNKANSNGIDTITISVSENTVITPRIGLVTAISGSKTVTVYVSQAGKSSGTNEVALANLVHVYPNPTNNKLNIIGLKGAAVITDVTGKTLMQLNGDGVYDLSQLASGMYFVCNSQGAVKIIKE